MNWHNFFHDLENWMEASNITMQKYGGIQNDAYWHWVVNTLSIIETRYDNPLACNILATILDYQTENWKKAKQQEE